MRKKTIAKRLAVLLTAGAVLATTMLTTLAATQASNSVAAGSGIEIVAAPPSQAYLDYLENGGTGDYVPSSLDLSYLNQSYASAVNAVNTYSLFPEQFDLRDQGIVAPVRNQNPYGTCWTFSSLGSAESGLIPRFPRTSFSNIHLNWFSYTGSEEEEYTWLRREQNPVDNIFNFGGNDQGAVAALAAWKGPVFSETVPYDVTEVDESLRYQADYHLQNAFYLAYGADMYGAPDLPLANSDIVKQILMEYGAVSVSYGSSDPDAFNEETSSYYCGKDITVDHAVLIVGWDDQYSRENFNEGYRPQKDGAWLIRNSWGTDWGDDGYFWLSYEDKTIDIGSFYQMEAADNYQRNYQYDTMGWGVSLGLPEDKSAYVSNVFTAEEDEQVEAVSFYTTDAGTEYEISVYTDLANPQDPDSGEKQTETQIGIEPYAGYHTIRLDEPVLLEGGETFSVVVKLTNPEYPYPIAAENCFIPLNQEEPLYLGNGGESYISFDGDDWGDLAGKYYDYSNARQYITNVCVKAFTNPVNTVSFSQMEGPIAFGEEVELTSPGTDAIYYTTDGSDPKTNGNPYTGPIAIDREMTIKAVAVKGGAFGEVREKAYTQAFAELTDLTLEQDGENLGVDLSKGETSFRYHVTNGTESMRVRPTATGTVTVNGQQVASNEWSQEIPLSEGEENTITIQASDKGKLTTDYTFTVYRSALRYDYRAETVSFDEEAYTLSDQDGTPVHSGNSVTPYILEEGDSVLTLVRITDGQTHLEYVPNRQVAVKSALDFVKEETTSAYGDWNIYSTSPDMSDAVKCTGEPIKVTPGVNIYLKKYATDTKFESKVVEIVVPKRPVLELPGIDFTKETTEQAIPEQVAYWTQDDQSDLAFGTGETLALTPGRSVYLQIPATSEAFASEVAVLAVPARPDAPDAGVEAAASQSITLKNIPGAEYRCGDGEWQASPVFEGLTPETEYAFAVRIAASGSNFASLESGLTVKTTAAAPSSSQPEESEPSGPSSEDGPPDGSGTDTPPTGENTPVLFLVSSLLAAGVLAVLLRGKRQAVK